MNDNEEDQTYHYIFGFGSIINTSTHGPWLTSVAADGGIIAKEEKEPPLGHLPGQRATLLASFGYRRGWNFRSSTGFTALGISRGSTTSSSSSSSSSQHAPPRDINGVVFRVTASMLREGFDRREVGYDRVEIPLECVHFHDSRSTMGEGREGTVETPSPLHVRSHEKIWVYVPQPSSLSIADEDHPILQSYVDTVMQGCLTWGGPDMCHEFVTTTTDWSPYFLNDTPSSRRPWLFRRQYQIIDAILQQHGAVTHFRDRRHPEEFAAAFFKLMRGAWNLPRRNPVFTGREDALMTLHNRFTQQRQHPQQIAMLQVAGMGGVGKTQLVTEYCYRYVPSYYGLVLWLAASSAESVAAGYRQFMADTTTTATSTTTLLGDNLTSTTDEVISQVKARLYRNQIPWLLVFDNLEDKTLLDKFVPAGGTCGHVLVTTRLMRDSNSPNDTHLETIRLGCLQPDESMELLCRTADIQDAQHKRAAHELSELLGHLPLALGMAAAYMRRCDVDCCEYLTRYVNSGTSVGVLLGHEAVSSSLQLTGVDTISCTLF